MRGYLIPGALDGIALRRRVTRYTTRQAAGTDATKGAQGSRFKVRRGYRSTSKPGATRNT